MSFRTPNWDKRRDAPNIQVTCVFQRMWTTEPFWRNIFESGKIRQVFYMRRDVERAVVKQSNVQFDCQIPANLGNLSIRRYTTYRMHTSPQAHLSELKKAFVYNVPEILSF